MLQHRDIIVIGASAGGVKALLKLCALLPGDLSATIFIVLHLSPRAPSLLPKLLARVCALPVSSAGDGVPSEPGHIYVAPPGRHLLLRPGRMALDAGPPEHYVRPAIDKLFRSAAAVYGPRVTGVLLSGMLADGTAGLLAIHEGGGVAVVQDPIEAQWSAMPRNALKHDHVNHCVTIDRMPELLSALSRETCGQRDSPAAETAVYHRPSEPMVMMPAQPASAEITAPASATGSDDELDQALIVAAKTHRERVALFQRMEQAAQKKGFSHAAKRWRLAGAEAQRMDAMISAEIDRRQKKTRAAVPASG